MARVPAVKNGGDGGKGPPGVKGRVALMSEPPCAAQHLLKTVPGERVMLPDFGCGLRNSPAAFAERLTLPSTRERFARRRG